MMKRIILTGGGTAGHVTPHLALIPRLQAQGFEVHYIGRKSGIESDLIAPTGILYHSISAGKFRRYVDIKNITDIFWIIQGFITSLFLIKKFHPAVIFSKGGFVSCPVVWAAWVNRVPIIIHESDLTLGLANKLSIPFADRVCFSFPETEAHLPKGKAIYTGIPIRETLHTGNKAEGRRLCGFTDAKPVVMIVGGSQGAESINRTVRTALNRILETFNVCHLCGEKKVDPSLETRSGYKQFEYVDQELPHLLAMADVVVSRAGATTLFELLELKKANLLIPLSRKASRGDQILNAKSFEKRGLSDVLTEENLTAEALIESLTNTYSHRQVMIETMTAAGSVSGIDNVMAIIEHFTPKDRTQL